MNQDLNMTFRHASVPKKRHAALFSSYLILELIMVILALILENESWFCPIPSVLCCIMIPSMLYMLIVLSRMCRPGFLNFTIGPDVLTLATVGLPEVVIPHQSIIAVDVQDFRPGQFYKGNGQPSGVNVTTKSEDGVLTTVFIQDLFDVKRYALAREILDWVDTKGTSAAHVVASNLYQDKFPQHVAVVTTNKERLFQPS